MPSDLQWVHQFVLEFMHKKSEFTQQIEGYPKGILMINSYYIYSSI
jgi:hypothetical protein